MKNRTGITLQQYTDQLEKQNGLCASCGNPETVTYKGRVKRLGVDYDPYKDEFYGLICNACNAAAGYFKHDPVRVRIAATYLQTR